MCGIMLVKCAAGSYGIAASGLVTLKCCFRGAMEDRSQWRVCAWRRSVLEELCSGKWMLGAVARSVLDMRWKRATRESCSCWTVSRSVEGRATQPRLKARVSFSKVSMRQWCSERAHGELVSISADSETRIDGTTGSQFWMSDQFILLRACMSRPVKIDRNECMLTGWLFLSL